MRYIDLKRVEASIPHAWLRKARKAFEDVKNSHSSDDINRRSRVWSELKDVLGQASHNKCWYCETKKIRDDFAVDHYRPKNEVKGCPEHPGYWWLAFDWTNFRYCCKYCNEQRKDKAAEITGGKLSHFPLLNPEKRVYDENGQISQEEPVLLDPCVESDPLLLQFDVNGFVSPTYEEEQEPDLYQRASESILRYNLNLRDLKESRQRICSKIVVLAKRGDRYFSKWKQGDISAVGPFQEVLDDLREMMQEDQEYSAAAKDALMTRRSSIWLNQKLLVSLTKPKKDKAQ